jgi:hypothetical protein
MQVKKIPHKKRHPTGNLQKGRRKSNDWLAQNQDNESEWGDMSIRGLVSVS